MKNTKWNHHNISYLFVCLSLYMCIYGKYMQIIIKEKDVHLRGKGGRKKGVGGRRGEIT